MQRGVRDQSLTPASLTGTLAKSIVSSNPNPKRASRCKYARGAEMFHLKLDCKALPGRKEYIMNSAVLER
jgi:hypothetical protein